MNNKHTEAMCQSKNGKTIIDGHEANQCNMLNDTTLYKIKVKQLVC